MTNNPPLEPATPAPKIETRLLYIFTRTPLHVGAGASIGAIDQPIQRERHTGLPIIPGSSLKGVFANEWTVIRDEEVEEPAGSGTKILVPKAHPLPERNWLFGTESTSGDLNAGALQFGEAKLLAFPVRSARGSFAWLTSPLLLRRALRDGVLPDSLKEGLKSLSPLEGKDADDQVLSSASSPLLIRAQSQPEPQIVLEDYTFTRKADLPNGLASRLEELIPADAIWTDLSNRLVVVSDGMMSFFATTACEIAQHVSINDTTGTADDGKLFNQENVPSDTLFYAMIQAVEERDRRKAAKDRRAAQEALETLDKQIREIGLFQFGGDASTGLGFCTVRLDLDQPSQPGGKGVAALTLTNPVRKM